MELAIQIETNGNKYFTRMAEEANSDSVKDIFLFLAKEEAGHIEDFKRIRESLQDPVYEIADEYKTPEMESYLTAMFDGRVFPNLESYDGIADEIKTDEQAIRHALSFEKDTILFFSEILRMLDKDMENRAVIEELIRQEKIHIAKLFTMLSCIDSKK
jgi:rubrerythrin